MSSHTPRSLPYPLGASLVEGGAGVAVDSKSADLVDYWTLARPGIDDRRTLGGPRLSCRWLPADWSEWNGNIPRRSARADIQDTNACCQDNKIFWFDWAHADNKLRTFTLLQLRRENPGLRPA